MRLTICGSTYNVNKCASNQIINELNLKYCKHGKRAYIHVPVVIENSVIFTHKVAVCIYMQVAFQVPNI